MLVAIGLRAVACWPVAQATACSPIATRISYCTARCWPDARSIMCAFVWLWLLLSTRREASQVMVFIAIVAAGNYPLVTVILTESFSALQKKQQKSAAASSASSSWDSLTPSPLTPAMEEVIAMRQKRISVEIDTPITPEPSDTDDEEDDHELKFEVTFDL